MYDKVRIELSKKKIEMLLRLIYFHNSQLYDIVYRFLTAKTVIKLLTFETDLTTTLFR